MADVLPFTGGLMVHCPRCGAIPHAPCTTLSGRQAGRVHVDRARLARARAQRDKALRGKPFLEPTGSDR